MLHVDPPRRVVLLRSRMEGQFVAVEVADRGTGLPAEQNGSIFEAFFTTKADGMGIGLSICKTIVEEHGGEIRAFANEFGGATFRILIPAIDKQSVDLGSPAQTGSLPEGRVSETRTPLEQVTSYTEPTNLLADEAS
jgi:nitrogen-specific signal transduction histidine kinase